MKKLGLLFCLMAVASFAFNMQAAKAYEGFNYAEGELNAPDADEENGWSTGWTELRDVHAQIVTEPIVYINDAIGLNDDTHGNSAVFPGSLTKRYLNEGDFPDEAGEVYWISFLENFKSEVATSGQWGCLFIVGFGENVPNFTIGANESVAGMYVVNFNGTVTNTDVEIQQDVPVWCVVKMVMSGDDSPENVYVWLNPDPSSEPNTDDAYANSDVNYGGLSWFLAGSASDAVQLQLDELVVADSWDEITLKTSIDQNATSTLALSCTPSIVNESATIQYNLAASQNVKVSLYNTLGSEVAVLVDGTQTAGSQEVSLSAEGLSDGVYLCKLQAGSDVVVTQIIVKK